MSWRNTKGFTLMEVLIVVAIIIILVAIAIPIFNTQLEKAREATDVANERAAKALGATSYLTTGVTGSYNFDAAAGSLVPLATKPAAYGQSTSAGEMPSHKGMYILVTIAADGTISCAWGGTGITYDGGDTPSTIIDFARNNAGLNPADMQKSIDSTAPDDAYLKSKMLAYFAANNIDLKANNINSWAVKKESGNTMTVWWSDVDISTVEPGSFVRVVRYNPAKGTYTAAWEQVVKNENGDYNVFSAKVKSGSDWLEAPGQSNESKMSYEETLKVFNSLEEKRATIN